MEQTWKVTVFFLRSYITDNCRKIRYKLSKDDCDGTRCPEATVFWWLLAIKTPYDNWELDWRPILSELGPKSWMRLDLHSCSNLGSLYFLHLQCFHLSQVDLGFNATLPQGNVNTFYILHTMKLMWMERLYKASCDLGHVKPEKSLKTHPNDLRQDNLSSYKGHWLTRG